MRFDINNNPALMQAAGNTPKAQYFAKVRMESLPTSEYQQLSIKANSNVVIKSIYQGKLYIQEFEYSPESYISVTPFDPNTMITIIGDLTVLSGYDVLKSSALTYVNLNKCTSLEDIYLVTKDIEEFNANNLNQLKEFGARFGSYKRFIFPNNPLLSEINLDRVTTLEEIDILSCTEIEMFRSDPLPRLKVLKCCATTNYVVSLINGSEVSNGVLTLRTGDPYNTQAAEAATAKGWTVEYVDA